MQIVISLTGSLVILILLTISVIHVYWAFGGTWGMDTAIPESDNGVKLFNPGVFGTLAVAAGLTLFAFVVAGSTGLLNINRLSFLFDYGIWLISLIFFARGIGEFNYVGLFKKVNYTKFAYWDTRLYSPLCLFIACLALLVAIA